MLDPTQKRDIYDLLASTFGTDSPFLVAQAGNCLAGHGYHAKALGYRGLNKMLEDMPEYVSFEQALNDDGNPFWQMTLKNQKDKASAQAKLPGEIRAFAYLPGATLEVLEQKLDSSSKGSEPILEVLNRAYRSAKDSGAICEEKDSCHFKTGLKTGGGRELSVFFAPNTRRGDSRPWALTRIYEGDVNEDVSPKTPDATPSAPRSNPGDALEEFADMCGWTDGLRTLAELALPEQWDFSDSKQKKHYILKQYLKYTFLRLKHEEKVLISEERGFAAFNTGLLTLHYEDIHVCFRKNTDEGGAPWKFSSFCTEGGRGDGQLITTYFAEPPQPASYITEVSDLLYDTRCRMAVNYDHILTDNIGRIPLSYLRDACNRYSEAVALIDKAEKQRYGSPGYNRTMRALADFCETTDNAFLSERIRSDFKRAIEKATKRIRWDYKTAVPIYYPAYNMLSLMIPLCLDSDDRADVALLVEKTESGNYLGHTILTLPMAYLDARLLCRPGSDWLAPELIRGSNKEE